MVSDRLRSALCFVFAVHPADLLSHVLDETAYGNVVEDCSDLWLLDLATMTWLRAGGEDFKLLRGGCNAVVQPGTQGLFIMGGMHCENALMLSKKSDADIGLCLERDEDMRAVLLTSSSLALTTLLLIALICAQRTTERTCQPSRERSQR